MASINLSHLSVFQRRILEEAKRLGRGSLSIPMGSGKTRLGLTIALLNHGDTGRPALIVAAKSLIQEWKAELLSLFGESVSYCVLHQNYCDGDVLSMDLSKYQIVLTTPEVVTKHYDFYMVDTDLIQTQEVVRKGRRMHVQVYTRPTNPIGRDANGGNPMYRTRWSTLLIDEGHTYLNYTTKRCRGMVGICAESRWLLSGTLFSEPKLESLFGYYLLIDDEEAPRDFTGHREYTLRPEYQGVKRTLVHRDRNEDYTPEEMGQKIHHTIVSHTLTKEEADFYLRIKRLIAKLYKRLEELKGMEDDELNSEARILNSIILGMVGYLRQSLPCPIVPLTSMYIAMLELRNRDSIVQQFTKELLDSNKAWLEDEESVYSSRFRETTKLIDKHPRERIVIYSDYRTVLDTLLYYMPQNRSIYTLRGKDSSQTREGKIKAWQDSECGILLLTYKIGSCGLNLQKGSVVIVLDYGWNIGATRQAVARVVRRGQEAEEVHVYYLTSNTGIERNLYLLHQNKLGMEKAVLEGEKLVRDKTMSLKDIICLIQMEDNYKVLEENI